MADVFRPFLGVQPLYYTNSHLQVLLPSKRLSSVFLYSYNSSVRRINRWPLHNNLVSEPSQISSSPDFDVISTHEHSDGSLIFRFGDPSEVSKTFQMEQSEVEEEVIQKESEGEDRVMEVLDSGRGRETNESSLDKQSEVDEEENQNELEGEENMVKVLDSDPERQTNESSLDEQSEFNEEEIQKESEGEDNVAKVLGGDHGRETNELSLDEETEVEEEEIHKESEREDNVAKVLGGDSGRESNVLSLDEEPEDQEEEIQKESEGENKVAKVLGDDRGRESNELCLDEEPEAEEEDIQKESEGEDNMVKVFGGHRGRENNDLTSDEEPEVAEEEIQKESEREGTVAKVLDGDGGRETNESNMYVESKVEEGEIHMESEGEDNPTNVLDGYHGRETNESSLDEVNGESISAVTGRQSIGFIEKETGWSGRLLGDSDRFQLSNMFSNVEANDVSIEDSKIKDNKIVEDGMQEEHEHSTTSEPMLDVNSNLENSFDGRECRQNSTTDVAKPESTSPNPDPAITVFENDVFLANPETYVVAEKQNDIVELELDLEFTISELTFLAQSVITEKGTDINGIVDVAPQAEVDTQVSTEEAEAQTSVYGPGLINSVVEDGKGRDVIPLISMSPKLEDKTTIDEGIGAFEDYQDYDCAESLDMPDAMHVTELEPAESTTESQEVPMADLFLSSGTAMLPHPSRVLTAGEDAYFVSGQTWLGIADGVGLWSFEGTSPGVYSKEFMRNCEKLISDCKVNPVNHPVELISLSVAETQSCGSSTVLIAQLVGQVLHVANIGDSGFIIVRHDSVYQRSSPMLHAFKFPLQIGKGDDPSILAEIHKIDLEVEDVIIIATDGLLDNLYDHAIASEVLKSLKADKALEEIAHVLATKAQEVGGSPFVRCPLVDDAQAAGYAGYARGNLDDVTVIVSVVQRRSK